MTKASFTTDEIEDIASACDRLAEKLEWTDGERCLYFYKLADKVRSMRK